MTAAHAQDMQNRRDKPLIEFQRRKHRQANQSRYQFHAACAASNAAMAASKAKSVEVWRAG